MDPNSFIHTIPDMTNSTTTIENSGLGVAKNKLVSNLVTLAGLVPRLARRPSVLDDISMIDEMKGFNYADKMKVLPGCPAPGYVPETTPWNQHWVTVRGGDDVRQR